MRTIVFPFLFVIFGRGGGVVGSGGAGGSSSPLDADAADLDAGFDAGDDVCACASPQPSGRPCPCTAAAAPLGCGSNWIPICCSGGLPCEPPPPSNGPITCSQGVEGNGWCCSGGGGVPMNEMANRRRFRMLGEDAALMQTDAGRNLGGVRKDDAPMGYLRSRLGRAPTAQEQEWFRGGWRSWIEQAEEHAAHIARKKAQKRLSKR